MAAPWLQSVSVLVLLVVWWPGTQAVTAPQHLCNSDLIDALYLVCGDRGFFYQPKRDFGRLRAGGGGSELDQLTINDQMEMLAKRGILEECCHNPCSILTLENYCN